MNLTDKVSIITANYNSESYVEKTIKSILEQSHKNWELIIVDDNSTDDSIKIIDKYLKVDNRIKLIKLLKNSGAGVARNKAIEYASGKYIAFLDSDDYWHSEKLTIQIAFMKKHKCNISYGSYYLIDENGDSTGYYVSAPRALTLKDMLKNDYIGFLTFMYDAENIGKFYMPIMRKRQDWIYKIIILQNKETALGIETPLAYYRKGHQSLSNNKIKLIKFNFSVYNKQLKYNKIKSTLKMIVFLTHYFIYKVRSVKKVSDLMKPK